MATVAAGPPSEAAPKILALVREPFEDYRKGDPITDRAAMRAIQEGPHAEFVVVLSPAK